MFTQFSLSDSFWSDFVEHHWQKSPVVIKQPFSGSLMTSSEVFNSLQQISERFLKVDRAYVVRLLLEGGFSLTGSQVGKYLPEPHMTSVDEYAQDLSDKLKRQQFALILNNFQADDLKMWLRSRDFFHGLLQRISPHIVHPTLFLGNYEQTPLGIHRDTASVFLFVLEGRKRIYAWPENYFPPQQSVLFGDYEKLDDVRFPFDYNAILKDAITLEAEAGDVIFWPNSYWHIGESIGGLSLSLNFGIQPCKPLGNIWKRISPMLENSMLKMVSSQAIDPRLSDLQLGNSTIISQVIEQMINTLQQMNKEHQLENKLRMFWLNLTTGSGFYPVPSPLPLSGLSKNTLVKADPDYPIQWVLAAEDEIICSSNGHSFILPAAPHILDLIASLNTGKTFSVKQLTEQFSGTTLVKDIEFVSSPEDIIKLLNKLFSLRAIFVQ